MRALLEMTSGLDINFNVSIYDGDTSQMHRTGIRDNARVVCWEILQVSTV